MTNIFRFCTMFFVFTGLVGCQSINYDVPLAEVELSNIKVEEDIMLASGKYELLVSFDYQFVNSEIAEPNDSNNDPAQTQFPQANLFFCTVQFLEKNEGTSSSSFKGRTQPCSFTEATGSISFRWPTPFDNSNARTANLGKLALPLQYFVAVHQLTAKNKSIVIAKSDTYTGAGQ